MSKYYKVGGAILASIAISLAVFVVSYLYFPINIFDEQLLGASITTIQGSDTLKDSRTTINNNFTSLNSAKMEATATSSSFFTSFPSLDTIGTIVSGIWHGSIIDVLYGGTGRSSLTSNAILLGNGTSGISTTTAGTDGQLLTYSSSSKPYWGSPSVNQTVNYSWSGTHSFASSTSFTGSTTYTATTTFAGPVVGIVSTSGVVAELATTSTVNNDIVVTTGFRPKTIRLSYYIQGYDGGGTAGYTGMKGIATYNTTSLASNFIIFNADSFSNKMTADNGTPNALTAFVNTAASTTAPTASGAGGATIVLSIQSVSSTGFTIREAVTGDASHTVRAKVTYEAFSH